MSAIADARLQDRDAAPCWYLQIAGLPWRPYAGAAPPADAAYTDVEAIEHVSRGGSTMEPDKGRVRQTGITISVATADHGDLGSMAQDLRRLRPEGARRRLLLLTSVEATGTADIEVTTDNGAWPSAGLLYIDDECIAYTGLAGDGSPGDRWRFTGITRAQLGTQSVTHFVDEAQAQQTWVVSDVVSWRTRPATLYLQMEGGTAWVEWMVGFVDGTPQGDDRGALHLRLVGWEGILDTELGGDTRVAGLSRQRHLLTVGVADQIVMTQAWEEGHGCATLTKAADAAGSGAITASTGQYDDVFDDSLAAPHPRHPKIKVRQATAPAPMLPTVAGPGSFTVTAPAEPSQNCLASEEVVNETTAEAYTATIDGSALGTEVLLRWPVDYLAAINAAWAPGTNKGVGGAWADVQIQRLDAGTRRPAVSVKLNSTKHAKDLLISWDAQDVGRLLAYPLRMAAPDVAPLWWTSLEGVSRLAWEREVRVGRTREPDNGRNVFAITDLAEAFYQSGEPVMLLDGAPAAAGVTFYWSATVDERGEERKLTFRGAISGASTEAGVTVGYRVEVEDPTSVPSFGDWPGFSRSKIRPAAVWREADMRRILVEILTSVEGAGVNGAYDVQPYGLAVPSSSVDVDQILSYPIPPALLRWSVTIDEARKASDILVPMLVAAGAVLQMHLDPASGVRKLRMVPVARAADVESVATLAADEWELDLAAPAADDRVINAWVFKLRTADGREVTDTWSDRASIRAHRETRQQTIDLRDARIDLADEAASGAAALRSIYGELDASYAWPRRLAAGAVSQDRLIFVDAGDVITVSCDELVGYDGTEGITSQPVRLQQVEHDVEGGRTQISGALTIAAGAGWNTSLYVEAVVSPTVVRVAANYYTDATGPDGQVQRDLDDWAVGDDAVMCPLGAWAGTVRTITAINTSSREVTFGAAHGLAAGDSIDPPSYTDASAVQKRLAYLADDALKLGAGDPAQAYS